MIENSLIICGRKIISMAFYSLGCPKSMEADREESSRYSSRFESLAAEESRPAAGSAGQCCHRDWSRDHCCCLAPRTPCSGKTGSGCWVASCASRGPADQVAAAVARNPRHPLRSSAAAAVRWRKRCYCRQLRNRFAPLAWRCVPKSETSVLRP